MSEASKEQSKFRLPSKAELLGIGAVGTSFLALAAPAAKANTLAQHPSSSTTEAPLIIKGSKGAEDVYVPPGELTPAGVKAGREGAQVLLEMVKGTRPNIVSSGVLELAAGTDLKFGPHKGSPGQKVPKGKVTFMEFPQLAVIDGRLVARGMLNKGQVDDEAIDTLYSRWVDVDQKTVTVKYLESMDPRKGYFKTIPAKAGGGNNLVFNATYIQDPPFPLEITLMIPNMSPKVAAGQEKYFAMDPRPGPKPTIADIHK